MTSATSSSEFSRQHRIQQCLRLTASYSNNTLQYFSVLDRHIKESRHPERGAIGEQSVKDNLLQYVRLFPPVSCHLEENVDKAVYGQGRFKSFTFQEMWQWYSAHKVYQADPWAGTEKERRMAQDADSSVRQLLAMKEDDISTKSPKRFRLCILSKEVCSVNLIIKTTTGAKPYTKLTLACIFAEGSSGRGPSC